MEIETSFVSWLIANGANFPKLQWPSYDNHNTRGVVAIDDIKTDEVILEIPSKLLMCEANFHQNPLIGQLIINHAEILPGDLSLCIFIMNEIKMGEASFYYPYLQILPKESNSILEWTTAELDMLQDIDLAYRAATRGSAIQTLFVTSVGKLSELYPEVFPSSEFTFERFRIAYYATCTRAFGKRLEWSALVPFADCLNHANVQTKYDYNVDGNGLFRLFPTGSNCYAKGDEVFNSYGRRKNDSLLIDYGFAMLDNEWEQFVVDVCADSKEDLYIRRAALIHSKGISIGRGLVLKRNKFPFQGFFIFRIMVASAGELTDLELAGGKVAVRSSSLLVGKSKVKVIDFNDLKVESSMQSLKHGSDTFSLLTRCLEKRAVKALLDLLEATRRKLPTSLSDDWEALKSLKYSSESAPSSSSQKLLLALIYRVTKKRILEIAILRLQALASHLDGVSKVSPESVEDSARRIWLSPMDVETLEPLTGSCDLCTVSDEGFFALHQYLVDVNESSD